MIKEPAPRQQKYAPRPVRPRDDERVALVVGHRHHIIISEKRAGKIQKIEETTTVQPNFMILIYCCEISINRRLKLETHQVLIIRENELGAPAPSAVAHHEPKAAASVGTIEIAQISRVFCCLVPLNF
jgi:hypothetical protein